jgi:hypothetical protein
MPHAQLAVIADYLSITNKAEASSYKDLITRAMFAYAQTHPQPDRKDFEQLEMLWMMMEALAAISD